MLAHPSGKDGQYSYNFCVVFFWVTGEMSIPRLRCRHTLDYYLRLGPLALGAQSHESKSYTWIPD